MKNIGILALVAFSAIALWIFFSSLSTDKLLIALSLVSGGLGTTFVLEENRLTGPALLCAVLSAACASLGFVFQLVL